MNICETHNRLRCGECAYKDELEVENIKLTKALEEIIEYYDWADYDSMVRVARNALGVSK